MSLIFKSDKPRDHLVVPDEHYFPGDNFRRASWLGQYIMDHRPEVIIRLGDMWDMPSLCSYDKGKKDFVFKSVADDIAAGHKAEKLIFGPMIEYNEQQARNKQKQYRPLIIKILGNHEHRVAKLLEYEPRWEGSLSMKNFHTKLKIDEEVVDFGDIVFVDDVAYSHYFVSGVMGRPMASAKMLVGKKCMSCTMGHVHTLDSAFMVKPTGEKARGLIAGSFHDPDHKSFAGTQVDDIWWNGLIHKKNVFNGDYDLTEISITQLQQMYEIKAPKKVANSSPVRGI